MFRSSKDVSNDSCSSSLRSAQLKASTYLRLRGGRALIVFNRFVVNHRELTDVLTTFGVGVPHRFQSKTTPHSPFVVDKIRPSSFEEHSRLLFVPTSVSSCMSAFRGTRVLGVCCTVSSILPRSRSGVHVMTDPHDSSTLAMLALITRRANLRRRGLLENEAVTLQTVVTVSQRPGLSPTSLAIVVS